MPIGVIDIRRVDSMLQEIEKKYTSVICTDIKYMYSYLQVYIHVTNAFEYLCDVLEFGDVKKILEAIKLDTDTMMDVKCTIIYKEGDNANG